MHRTAPRVLSVVVGAVIMACALVLASGRRAKRLQGRRGLVGAGAISAAMNTASGVGGPAVAMYALNADWPIEMSRPTLQVYFLGLNMLSFVALGPVRLHVGPAAALAAAILFGYVGGSTLVRRLNAAVIGRAILVLSMAGGAAAIIRGLVAA